MPEVTIGLGAVLDLASSKEVSDGFLGLTRALRGVPPNIKRLNGSVQTDAVGALGSYFTIDLGGPSTGAAWDVRSIVVCAVPNGSAMDAFNAVTAVSVVPIVAQLRPAPGVWEVSGLVSGVASLPADIKLSEAIPVRPPSHLWVWCKLTAAFPSGIILAGAVVYESVDQDMERAYA